MKKTVIFIVIILLSASAGWVGADYRLQHTDSTNAVTNKAAESAYDRVMRTGVLRCGYQVWSPFFEKNAQTGEVTGLLKDIIDQMVTGIGLKAEYVEVSLGQQPQDLAANKYDSFCFDSFLMPKASKFVDYTKPWGYSTQWVFGLDTASTVNILQDLNTENHTFSAMDGDLSLDLATRFFPKAKLLSLANNADPALLMLNITTRKSDVVITDEITIQKFNQTNTMHLKPLFNKPVAIYPLNFSVKKGEVDLQNMLNYAVDIFVYTGPYMETLDKYDPERFILRVDNKRN